jgi:hypothetical protein
MDEIAGLPFFPLEITKDGKIFSAQQVTAIDDAVRKADAVKLTDLLVVSHGWNNDMADARDLYNELFTNFASLMPSRASAAARKFAIAGVFWPSKKFADEELIPSGGAVSIELGGNTPTSSALKKKLDSLKGVFDVPDAAALEHAKGLIDALDDSPAKQREFVDVIRSLVPQDPSDTTDDASNKFLRRPGDELLKALAPASSFPPAAAGHGGILRVDDNVGGAVGLGDLFSGMKAAAWRLLNFATYYQMKERAGVVGRGLNGLLGSLRQLRPDLRLHLIGHSFGARVVTAAADGQAPFQPSSLALLQGAFSHNGFAEKFDQHTNGFFRKVVSQSKVNGPIVVTHTVNDRAVGIAYPLASRLSSDNRSALGDENDVYGGIGRNGAVNMKVEEFVKGRLLPHTGAYQFAQKKIHNLRADDFISSHDDVTGKQVANALLHAVSG